MDLPRSLLLAAAGAALLLGLIAWPSARAQAQGRDAPRPGWADAADAAVVRYMADTRAPGAAMAVIHRGEVIYVRGYGVADLQTLAPATPRTVFRLASVSKPITAVTVLQLAEQGRLSLDQPVGAYSPNLPPAIAALTLRDLLRHTAGVRTYRGEEFFSTTRCENLADAARIFSADPLDHEVGARQTYSTYGYTLLGLAVEGASRRRFFDQVRRGVLRPLGMRRTYPDDPRVAVSDRATPYVRLAAGGVGPARPVDNTCKVPGGGMQASLNDVAAFAAGLQRGRLLGPAAQTEMIHNQLTAQVVTATLAGQTAAPEWGYGYGFQTGTARHTTAVLHTGGGVGATTILYWLPAQQLSVVVLSNIQDAGGQITALADDVADLLEPPAAAPQPALPAA